MSLDECYTIILSINGFPTKPLKGLGPASIYQITCLGLFHRFTLVQASCEPPVETEIALLSISHFYGRPSENLGPRPTCTTYEDYLNRAKSSSRRKYFDTASGGKDC